MSWTSTISPREIVIGDDSPVPAPPPGYGLGFVQRDFEMYPQGFYAPPIGDEFLIPREELYDRAREMEEKRRRISDFAKAAGWEVKNQKSLPYCWIFSVTGACEKARILAGQKHIQLSAASTGARITGFRQRGGWCEEAAKGIEKWGLVPESSWPEATISNQYNTDAAWKEAEKYELKEWNELPVRNIHYQLSLLLRGIPYAAGHNWWSHAIEHSDVTVLKKPNGTSDQELLACFGIRFPNSWGTSYGENGYGILTGSKMLNDGAVAIRSMRLTTEE